MGSTSETKFCGGPSQHHNHHHHVVLYPFMSKGHTIPLLHLAGLLLRRGVTVTIFSTPANRAFIAKFLAAETSVSIIDIPFPQDIPGVPPGIESTDKLPSMSLFPPFARATKLMQPEFERALEALPPVDFMVSDGFLWWTVETSVKFGFPRLMFFGMSNYASAVSRCVVQGRLLFGPESDDELITLPEFPWIKVARNDFHPPFTNPEPKGDPHFELLMLIGASTMHTYGTLVNSFYELEPTFADYMNMVENSKCWNVGPLCLAEQTAIVLAEKEPDYDQEEKPSWLQWLDRKLEQGSSVLYVAFGSQAEISQEQLLEIATGLEESMVNVLWVIREKGSSELAGFEERVKGRGIIVREWVDQKRVLMHPSVEGFVSHCGWNSVMESICAGVPILAWPMMAEQPLNARMVVDEIKVGLRVETCDGSVRGFVKWEGLKKTVRELMEGEMGKEVRKKAKEYAEMAKNAMEEGRGSSWRTLDMIIDEICNGKQR